MPNANHLLVMILSSVAYTIKKGLMLIIDWHTSVYMEPLNLFSPSYHLFWYPNPCWWVSLYDHALVIAVLPALRQEGNMVRCCDAFAWETKHETVVMTLMKWVSMKKYRHRRKRRCLQRSTNPLPISSTPCVCSDRWFLVFHYWMISLYVFDGKQSSASNPFFAIYGNFQWKGHVNAPYCSSWSFLPMMSHLPSITKLCIFKNIYPLEAYGMNGMSPHCAEDLSWGWG